MTRAFRVFVGTLLVFAMTTAVVAVAQVNTIEMAVSPSTLNLKSNGGSVSIHAVIAYNAVTEVELTVDGQSVINFGTFADDRGELVVKCDIDMIKSMVSVGTATFDLTAHTQNGTYVGTDTIRVIDRGK